MLAEASIRRIGNLLGAGMKIPTHRPTRITTLEADALGQATHAAAAQRECTLAS
jgi:hypothetical protein